MTVPFQQVAAATQAGQARSLPAQSLLDHAVQIWSAGGSAMWALVVIALLMFGIGAHVFAGLIAKGHLLLPEAVWREWIVRPSERHGPIGDILDANDGSNSVPEVAAVFDQIRTVEIGPFQRDLRVMKVFVSAAPLVGLLGTVIGMLTTFGALATGSGGDQTMAQIASGISEALVTTETGLVIAIPGLFMHYRLRRRLEVYEAFLAHVETVCMQDVHNRRRKERRRRAREVARQQVLSQLSGKLAVS